MIQFVKSPEPMELPEMKFEGHGQIDKATLTAEMVDGAIDLSVYESGQCCGSGILLDVEEVDDLIEFLSAKLIEIKDAE